jgi:hypothetical protein
MPKKRTPAAERQQETSAIMKGSSAGALLTGRIPGLVPGRESALTWAGEPLKMSGQDRWSRGAS